MKIIALKGPSNSGKTETLNTVFQLLLLFGYSQISDSFKHLGHKSTHDFLDILERKGRRIGICTMGDHQKYSRGVNSGEIVQDLIQLLQEKECSVIICACNKDLTKAIAFIQSYPHEFVDKYITINESEQRLRNEEDAEMIYKLI
jgi:hypothetical protein